MARKEEGIKNAYAMPQSLAPDFFFSSSPSSPSFDLLIQSLPFLSLLSFPQAFP